MTNFLRYIVLSALVLGLAACGTDVTSEPELETTLVGDAVIRLNDKAKRNHFHLVLPPTIRFGNFNGAENEGILGYDAIGRSGTATVWSCIAGSDNFVSRDPKCEGKQRTGQKLQQLGIRDDGNFSVFTSGGKGRVAIYRCRVRGVSNHFISRDSGCEDQITEGRLGWLLAS